MIIDTPIQPDPDSDLGQRLARLLELREKSQAEQTRLANMRAELQEEGNQLRRRSHIGGGAPAYVLDEMQAAIVESQKHFDRETKRAKPLLDQLHEEGERFQRDYATWLKARRAADEAERLGGR